LALNKTNKTFLPSHVGNMYNHNDVAPTFSTLFHTYNMPLNCLTGALLSEQTIYKYAIDKKVTSQIGGPVTILKIDVNNKITFLKTTDYPSFNNYEEFVKSVKSKQTPVVLLDSDSERKVNYYLDRELNNMKSKHL